jgi:hypothetical protein
VTRGYLTYTYLVVDPVKETGQKVIVDAGNGQLLYTSEGQPMGSFSQLPMFGPLGVGKGHGSFGVLERTWTFRRISAWTIWTIKGEWI